MKCTHFRFGLIFGNEKCSKVCKRPRTDYMAIGNRSNRQAKSDVTFIGGAYTGSKQK